MANPEINILDLYENIAGQMLEREEPPSFEYVYRAVIRTLEENDSGLRKIAEAGSYFNSMEEDYELRLAQKKKPQSRLLPASQSLVSIVDEENSFSEDDIEPFVLPEEPDTLNSYLDALEKRREGEYPESLREIDSLNWLYIHRGLKIAELSMGRMLVGNFNVHGFVDSAMSHENLPQQIKDILNRNLKIIDASEGEVPPERFEIFYGTDYL